jgi:TRAP-type C4-dicarboxylate transport system permease small subunit
MRAIVRWITRFNQLLATIAGLFTALITLIICIDVGSRGLLNRSVQGASDLAILLLVALIFLGFAGAEAKGENFAVTLLVRKLAPRPRRVLDAITTSCAVAAVGLLAWFSWTRAIDSVRSGEQSYGVIAFPVWPSKLVIAFGLSMLLLQLIARVLVGTAESDRQ